MSLRSGFTLLVSLSVLAALMGCGGSSSTPNNTITGTTSTNNQLTGTYAFSISGLDVNGQFFAFTGAFTADGNGSITGGAADYNNPGDVGVGSNLAITGGSYAVGSDGRGTATLKVASLPQGSIGVDFVLSSTSHGLITEFDKNGSGSGTFDLQGSASQSAGSYSFSFSGSDVNAGGPFTAAGAFTLDGSGHITTGVYDLDDANTVITGQSLGVGSTVMIASGTTPGTAQLITTLGTFSFDVYAVDQTHLKFIETDTTGDVLAGDAFTQQTSIATGPVVFTIGGLDGSGNPLAAGGFMTFNPDGVTVSGGSEDVNDDGTVASAVSFTGSYSALTGGRAELSLSGFTPAVTFAIYPSSGGLLMQEIDGGLSSGTALAQTATSFSTTGGYGFNLSAFNLGGGVEVDDIAAFTATSTNITGTIDENDEGSTLSPGQALSGTYSATGGGRGTMTLQGGSFNADYYVASSSSVLLIETDPGSTGQVGTGQFLGQTAVGDSASAILRAAMARPITIHPATKNLKKVVQRLGK